MELAKLELKMLIGTADGIEFMAYLVRTDKIDFDKAAFLKAIATHKDKDKCYKTETKIGPQMPKVVGEESLGKLDSTLNKKILGMRRSGHIETKYSRPAWTPRIAGNWYSKASLMLALV